MVPPVLRRKERGCSVAVDHTARVSSLSLVRTVKPRENLAMRCSASLPTRETDLKRRLAPSHGDPHPGRLPGCPVHHRASSPLILGSGVPPQAGSTSAVKRTCRETGVSNPTNVRTHFPSPSFPVCPGPPGGEPRAGTGGLGSRLSSALSQAGMLAESLALQASVSACVK